MDRDGVVEVEVGIGVVVEVEEDIAEVEVDKRIVEGAEVKDVMDRELSSSSSSSSSFSGCWSA